GRRSGMPGTREGPGHSGTVRDAGRRIRRPDDRAAGGDQGRSRRDCRRNRRVWSARFRPHPDRALPDYKRQRALLRAHPGEGPGRLGFLAPDRASVLPLETRFEILWRHGAGLTWTTVKLPAHQPASWPESDGAPLTADP